MICCFPYLYTHWVLHVCALTMDRTRNVGALGGQCSNQQTYPARTVGCNHTSINFGTKSLKVKREEHRQRNSFSGTPYIHRGSRISHTLISMAQPASSKSDAKTSGSTLPVMLL